ncbi:MAG TPA: hypothetical protein VF628_12000 [Allosphingosinicella sp.]
MEPAPADHPDWNSIASQRGRDPAQPAQPAPDRSRERVLLRLVKCEATSGEAAPHVPTFRDWRERTRGSAMQARGRA